MQVFDRFAAQKCFVSWLGLGYNAASQLEQGSSISKLYLIGGGMRKASLQREVCLAFLLAVCGVLAACGSGNVPMSEPTVAITKTANPLVAVYTITPICQGQAMVEFGTDTTYGRSTAWYPTQAFTANILVAGMKASTTYHMRSQYQCNNSTFVGTSGDQTFTTGALPSTPFPKLAIARPNPSLSSTENPGIELLDLIDEAAPSGIMKAVITDRDANPIWYYDTGVAQGYWPYTYKLMPNGHMIFSITQTVAQGTILREVDLAGNTVREMNAGVLAQKMQAVGFNFQIGGFHHDLIPMDNGHLILLCNYYQPFTDLPGYPGVTKVLGDAIVDLDPDWNPVWAWSAFDHLDVNRHLNGLPDWTHGNAVVYSPNDGNLLLSMRHQSWVIKIDYNNGTGAGDVLWKLGYQGDFSLPTDDPSEWFSFQHYPWILSQSGPQTTLAIWDNGDNRVMNTNGQICGVAGSVACYSRATIFQIDESTKAATLLWDDLPGLFSFFAGSINQLQNGNVEFDLNAPSGQSFAAQVQEVTHTADPQIVWEMTIPFPTYAYRAYRIPSLYPGVSWSY
jgi:arylsulfate sulfotransferase